jgi:hypothetical protein
VHVPRIRPVSALVLAGTVMTSAAVGYLRWAHASVPESVEVLGIVGNIGEWEMLAKLERQGDTRELAGSMKMTHIGRCVQDGPQEKTGELRIKLARLSSSIVARVRFDGVECDYSASLTDAYSGKLACPDRRSVQMLLWMR